MPSIYVASLADYNNGNLFGVWIDADLDVDDMQEAIHLMLKESKYQPAEDWAIHDSEGFGNVSISENMSLESISIIAQLLEKHDNDLVAELIEYYNDLNVVEDELANKLYGVYDGYEEFAKELLSHIEVPKELDGYIDWDFIGQNKADTEFNSFMINDTLYVFSS
jgi:antirestriction protein